MNAMLSGRLYNGLLTQGPGTLRRASYYPHRPLVFRLLVQGGRARSEARNTLMSQVTHSARVLSTPDPGWGVSVGMYRAVAEARPEDVS